MNKEEIEERTTWSLMAWTLIPIGLILFFFVISSRLGLLGAILGTSAVIALLLGILSLVALLSEKQPKKEIP